MADFIGIRSLAAAAAMISIVDGPLDILISNAAIVDEEGGLVPRQA